MAVISTWLLVKIFTVISPASPNVPPIVVTYDPGVVGLTEFVPSYEMIILSFKAKTADPIPSVGAVNV